MRKSKKGWVLKYQGKYWGVVYSDGRAIEYGWTADIDEIMIASVSNEKPPSKDWFTYSGSPLAHEMGKGEWVLIEIVKELKEQ